MKIWIEEEKVDRETSALVIDEMRKLAETLGMHLSTHTKFYAIPKGTLRWKIAYNPGYSLSDPYAVPTYNTKIIEIVPFLGTHIGYDAELDVLLFWDK